jgi:hypothetical protein
MSPVIYVFDFDATLRPMYCYFNKRRAAKARVRETVQALMQRPDTYVGINTARPFFLPMRKRYLHYVFGFSLRDLPPGAVQYSGTSPRAKVANLVRILRAYEQALGTSIPRSAVWLFDDRESNVTAAQDAGFKAVLVDKQNGCHGLTGRHTRDL